eukprot:ANDGO_00048.mRNA.1 Arsenical pump membrane protein
MEEGVAQWVVLVGFIVALALVMVPVTIPVPRMSKGLRLNYVSAPLFVVVCLMIVTAVPPLILADSLVGDSTIRPFTIIILFFSLAYVCTSLDSTNVFAFAAVNVVQRAGKSRTLLFLSVFFFSSILTVCSSNDIVVLVLTPIISHLSKISSTDPKALFIAEFFAANILSVVLIIGNPTNVIAGEAYGLTFTEYLQWMAVPGFVACFLAAAVLYLYFRKSLNEKSAEDNDETHFNLDLYQITSKPLTIFKCSCFFICLMLFSVSNFLSLSLWVMCLGGGVFFLIVDCILDASGKLGKHELLPVVWSNLKRLPYSVAPFMLGMFSLVNALETVGWIGKFAEILGSWSSNVTFTVLFLGFLTCYSCSLVNNQPMTILFTRTILHHRFTSDPLIRKAAIFSLIIASNFGANFSFVASMAGLMFKGIISRFGMSLRGSYFSKVGALTMNIVLLVALVVLRLELLVDSTAA